MTRVQVERLERLLERVQHNRKLPRGLESGLRAEAVQASPAPIAAPPVMRSKDADTRRVKLPESLRKPEAPKDTTPPESTPRAPTPVPPASRGLGSAPPLFGKERTTKKSQPPAALQASKEAIEVPLPAAPERAAVTLQGKEKPLAELSFGELIEGTLSLALRPST